MNQEGIIFRDRSKPTQFLKFKTSKTERLLKKFKEKSDDIHNGHKGSRR